MTTITHTPTLTEDPRRFLGNRARRLEKLCTLVAPAAIINGEVKMLAQAVDALLRKEEPGLMQVYDLAEPEDFREQYMRCMDMLGDVPGTTLEDRLTNYIGHYMAVGQLSQSEPNHADD
jgi:DNA-directed RNA polymerase beta' subunit